MPPLLIASVISIVGFIAQAPRGVPKGTETAWMTTPKEKAELIWQVSETNEMIDAAATRYDEWVGRNGTD